MIATFKTSDFVCNLKAALLAASGDTTRPWLCCVRIELDATCARFVATNGHWLWVNETHCREFVGTDKKGKPVIGTSAETIHVSVADVKAILKWIDKSKKALDRDVELDSAGSVRQFCQTLPFKPLDVAFPPYAQLIPSGVTPGEAVMTYEPEYVADVTAAFYAVSSSDTCGICFEPSGGAEDPVVVTSDTSSALAVLMPRRHSTSPAGASLVARYRADKTPAVKAA